MTLYEMCQEWAKLAPNECQTDYGDVQLTNRNDEKFWLNSVGGERKPSDLNALVFDSVSLQLEARQKSKPFAEELLEFTLTLHEKGYLGEIAVSKPKTAPALYESKFYELSAPALLEVYLQYLKAAA